MVSAKVWTSKYAVGGLDDTTESGMPTLAQKDVSDPSHWNALRDSVIAMQGNLGKNIQPLPALAGCQGHWPLNGDLEDDSANGLDLSLLNGTERYARISGQKVFAFDFATGIGRNQYDPELASLGEVSIVACCAPLRQTGTDQVLVEFSGFDGGSAENTQYVFSFRDNGQPYLYWEGGTAIPRFSDPPETVIPFVPQIHVVTRNSSLECNFYSGGRIMDGPIASPGDINDGSNSRFILGQNRNSVTTFRLAGLLWDVQIYQRVLSASEVLDLAVAGGYANA